MLGHVVSWGHRNEVVRVDAPSLTLTADVSPEARVGRREAMKAHRFAYETLVGPRPG